MWNNKGFYSSEYLAVDLGKIKKDSKGNKENLDEEMFFFSLNDEGLLSFSQWFFPEEEPPNPLLFSAIYSRELADK